VLAAKSQATISPSQNNEYCPNTEYTFTASLPKAYSSMIGEGGCYVTQSPSGTGGYNITFKGKFADANQKQTFRIYYTDGSNDYFDFKKIKSLFYGGASCTPIQTNITTINAPRCQIVNTAISFSNIQWGTNFETPSLCFGSIANYEYQLPAGWSIGSNVSTGSNWIAGGNSVTITSDLASGINGGVVLIRPTNNCGSGLSNGYSPKVVSISRPAPTLEITPYNTTICSGSSNLTISGVPSGASVAWSVSDPTQASVTASPTNQNIATVTRTGSANINLTVTATVTHCSFSYTATQKVILGSPAPVDIIGMDATHFSAGQYVTIYINEAGSSYNWSVAGGTIIGSSTDQIITAKLDKCFTGQTAANEFTATVSYQNTCGTSTPLIETSYADCDGNDVPDFRMAVSPNPAKGSFSVEISQETKAVKLLSSETTVYYKLYDLFSNRLVKQWVFKNVQNLNRLSTSGVRPGKYVLIVTKGKFRQSKQIIIE
jgi:hypothetical protein